jgi:site-specific DNA-methyltransferase (adenine-specific)
MTFQRAAKIIGYSYFVVIEIVQADNLTFLQTLPDGYFRTIYIDPPYNTGKTQSRKGLEYKDSFGNYHDFIMPRIKEAHRILSEDGSLFIHLDWRESHYVKVWSDEIFGRDHFQNEIIWAYDYGARSKSKWSAKHDTILWYSKSDKYIFNYDAMERIPYMAPGLVGPEKAAKGKTLTDVWWHTIVPTNGKEKTGYPTQKPLGILDRIVKVHSLPGDFLLDFFAGSGSFGEAADRNGRNCLLVDENPQAIQVMIQRFGSRAVIRP